MSVDASQANSAQWIRISCAVLCRITHVDRYLLLINANRRQKGLYILSPIGGALAVRDSSVFEPLGLIPERANNLDLRGLLPVARLDDFRAWFQSGEGRERSPFRELQEELVEEAQLLPELTPEDVRTSFLRMVEEESLTQRGGQTGMLTHYFLEIYDVVFTRAMTLGPLLVSPPDSGAMWVTEEDIRNRAALRMTIDGAEHEVHVRGELLLPPQPPPSA